MPACEKNPNFSNTSILTRVLSFLVTGLLSFISGEREYVEGNRIVLLDAKSQLRTRAFDALDTSNCIMLSPNRSPGITLEKFAMFGLSHPSRGLNTEARSEYMSQVPTSPSTRWGLHQPGPIECEGEAQSQHKFKLDILKPHTEGSPRYRAPKGSPVALIYLTSSCRFHSRELFVMELEGASNP